MNSSKTKTYTLGKYLNTVMRIYKKQKTKKQTSTCNIRAACLRSLTDERAHITEFVRSLQNRFSHQIVLMFRLGEESRANGNH